MSNQKSLSKHDFTFKSQIQQPQSFSRLYQYSYNMHYVSFHNAGTICYRNVSLGYC